MTWEEDMANTERQQSSVSDFYKFVIGDHVMRIMSMPVKKESRFGYGICYPGAPYCDPANLEKEYQDKMKRYGEEVEAARQRGASKEELKAIKKPSRTNISLKWAVWALVRRSVTGKTKQNPKGVTNELNELKMVDLPHGISEALLALKTDQDMGTSFDGFPMPYDVKITVTQKNVPHPTNKDIEYSLVAGQLRTEVTQDELDDLEKKTPVEQILERMYEKQRERTEGDSDTSPESHSGGIEYPKDDINPDDIPF